MEAYNQFICGHDGDALEIRNDATSGTYQPSQWMIDWATGGRNDAGVAVNGYTALTSAPVWQAVNIVAGDVGQTPIKLMRNKFEEQNQHPSSILLRGNPNRLQSVDVWMETMIQWMLIWGNGVSWIRRQGSRPVELIPLRPDCLWHRVMAFEDQEILLYHYRSPYPEGTGGTTYTFFPWEVLHFKSLTSDGVWGYPLWQVAANTIGQELGLEKHSNKQLSNGARPGGVLEHPQKLSPEARDNLRADWNKIHSGPDNTGKIAILWEGMKFNPISSTNVESELTELIKLSVYKVAALFNLPPHMLGAMDGAKYNNIEEQNANYKSRTLNRIYNRINGECKSKLLTEKERLTFEYEYVFDANAFLSGDMDTQMTIGDKGVKATILCPNEARGLIGFPPYPGGDKYQSPAINPAGANPNENSPSSAGKTPKQPPKGANNVENAHKALLHDRILHLLECETTRLRHAAKGVKNFVAWLDDFYCNGKFDVLSAEVMGVGIRAAWSVGINVEFNQSFVKYAKHRHSVLLEACSDVTKEQLPAAIEKLINSEQELVAQGLLATSLGGNEWDSE